MVRINTPWCLLNCWQAFERNIEKLEKHRMDFGKERNFKRHLFPKGNDF